MASCSEDSSICVWEEQESATAQDTEKWIRKIKLSNSKKSGEIREKSSLSTTTILIMITSDIIE